MYNKVVIMGRITQAVEVKITPQGVSVTTFSVAVDRSYSGKGQEKQTDFFNCVAWRGTAEFIANYFGKGKMILIEGELQNRTYKDKDGNNKQVTEIIVQNVHFTGEPKDSKPIPKNEPQPQEQPEQASADNYPF